MKHAPFVRLIDEVLEHCREVLTAKNIEYAREDDKLHNFHRAAAYLGCTPLRAAQGIRVKHTVSIADFLDDLERGVLHPREQWLEKIGDEINYLLLIFALLHEECGWPENRIGESREA